MASTQRSADRTTFLSEILSTGLEGGINHWATVEVIERVDISEGIPEWRYELARILDQEDGSEVGTMHTIDLDTVAHGLALMAEDDNPRFDALRTANRTNGTEGDFDAGDADATIQLGLFEHIIYG